MGQQILDLFGGAGRDAPRRLPPVDVADRPAGLYQALHHALARIPQRGETLPAWPARGRDQHGAEVHRSLRPPRHHRLAGKDGGGVDESDRNDGDVPSQREMKGAVLEREERPARSARPFWVDADYLAVR